MSLRIRGIYATALSALLPKHGFEVVEASPVIADRLGLRMDGAAEVQLRDRPDQQGVRLQGARAACAAAAGALTAMLPDAVARELRGSSAVWEVEFPGGSKRELDDARAEVWPTLPGHHQLKIVAGEAVDRAEEALAGGRGPAEALASDLWERYVYRVLQPGRPIVSEHVKPDGRELRLPGTVRSFQAGRLWITRGFRHGGTYDTLGAPKLGDDYGETEQLVGSWVSRRRYLRASGALIGELYNVQAPTELYPTAVRYLDLEVDVAVWPKGRVEIVDLDELQTAVRLGHIASSLSERALAIAEGLHAALSSGAAIQLEDWR